MSLGRAAIFIVATVLPCAVPRHLAAQKAGEHSLPQITTHDNTAAAGWLQNGVLGLSLRAAVGRWHPEGDAARTLQVEAFGEAATSLVIPSPLIRVPAGTTVHATIHNTLAAPLRVHGLCERPGPCAPFTIEAGATEELRFTLRDPGTFHYWAATVGSTLELRDGRDSQMGGAIVVDSPGEAVRDRVFVMGLIRAEANAPESELTVINGRSWPFTERLRHEVGDTLRWRLVNLTSAPHAMHLHGFYFEVGSVGDIARDTRYGAAERRLAVTEQLAPGRTMTMSWAPERAGNWLFHCHMLTHMMPTTPHSSAGPGHGAAAGMAGLVLGVEVSGPRARVDVDVARRDLSLVIEHDDRNGATSSYRVDLTTSAGRAPRLNERTGPGPIMVLTRGEPVAVEIVNRLTAPTAIHWHGIELESYDDGVPGFSGSPGSVTPAVPPGGSFTARFTPARAGTFIYHTHWHDPDQLAGGIYGPLIVLEPGESYDPVTDHIVVIGLDGAYRPIPDESFVVNGVAPPAALDLSAGVAHRLRFINITADNVALTVQLLAGFDPIQWTLEAKDGAAVSAAQRSLRAARQLVAVGETYDFLLAPMAPRPVGLWLELRRGNGELLFQWPVRVH